MPRKSNAATSNGPVSEKITLQDGTVADKPVDTTTEDTAIKIANIAVSQTEAFKKHIESNTDRNTETEEGTPAAYPPGHFLKMIYCRFYKLEETEDFIGKTRLELPPPSPEELALKNLQKAAKSDPAMAAKLAKLYALLNE